jgi:hypothetical protein
MSTVRSHSGAIAGFLGDFKRFGSQAGPQRVAQNQGTKNSTDRPVSKSQSPRAVKSPGYLTSWGQAHNIVNVQATRRFSFGVNWFESSLALSETGDLRNGFQGVVFAAAKAVIPAMLAFGCKSSPKHVLLACAPCFWRRFNARYRVCLRAMLPEPRASVKDWLVGLAGQDVIWSRSIT